MTNDTGPEAPATCHFTAPLAGRQFACIREPHDHHPDEHVMVKPYEAPVAGSAEPTLRQVDDVVLAFTSALVLSLDGDEALVSCEECATALGSIAEDGTFRPLLATDVLDHIRSQHPGSAAAQALDGVPAPQLSLGPSV